MRGKVTFVDSFSGDGLISGDDLERYSFLASAARDRLRVGDMVDFVAADGVATDIIVMAGSPSRIDLGPMPRAPRYAHSGGIDWSHLLWSPEGRIRRSHFWAAWGLIFAANLLLGWIPVIGTLVGLALFWPSIAIQTKRLHDMGRTGWLQLLPIGAWIVAIVVMIASFGVTAATNPDIFDNEDFASMMSIFGPTMIAVALVLLASLGFLIWIGATEGQAGRNRFGPSPKYSTDDTADTFN